MEEEENCSDLGQPRMTAGNNQDDLPPRLIALSKDYYFRTEAEIKEPKGSYLKMAIDLGRRSLSDWSTIVLSLVSVQDMIFRRPDHPGDQQQTIKGAPAKKRMKLLQLVDGILDQGENANPFKIHPNYLHLRT